MTKFQNWLNDISSSSHFSEESEILLPILNPVKPNYSKILGDIGALRCNLEHENNSFAHAVYTLAKASPVFFREFSSTVKYVVLFTSIDTNSFVRSDIPETIFIAVTAPPTEGMFIEEFAHQGGHQIFSKLGLQPERYFKESPFLEIDCSDGHTRTAYEILHGIVTLYLMSTTFHQTLIEGSITSQLRRELSARLVFTSHRFKIATLGLLDTLVLSQEGIDLVANLSVGSSRLLNFYRAPFFAFDFHNQDYTFSLRKFLAANPE